MNFKLDEVSLGKLFNEIKAINKALFENNFGDTFDFILFNLVELFGDRKDNYLIPQEVIQLIHHISDLPNRAEVYNPYAGMGMLGDGLIRGQKYYGQNIDARSWAIGTMRNIAHIKNGSFCFEQNNPLVKWPNTKNYDLVVSFPPSQKGKELKEQTGHFSLESFFVSEGLKSLKPNGKLVLLTRPTFLSQSGYFEQVRKELIDKGAIEQIVTLPSSLFSHSSLPFVIVVLSNTIHKKIKLTDASSCIIAQKPSKKQLDLSAVLELIDDNKDNKTSKWVDLDQVQHHNYNLNVTRYLLDAKGNTTLSDCCRTY